MSSPCNRFASRCAHQLEEGKYLLLKDPNKPVVRFYSVPTDAFDEAEEPEPLPDEDEDEN